MSSHISRVISRSKTGIPYQSRTPHDPPSVSHSLLKNIRVRCVVNIQAWPTPLGPILILPTDPVDTFEVRVHYDPNRISNQDKFWSYTYNDIFRAAAIRLYGYDIYDGITHNYNVDNTEFALQSVTLYGTEQRIQLSTDSYRLNVDFGYTIPGFTGRAHGGADSRATITTSAPRLVWSKIDFSETKIPAVTCASAFSLLPVKDIIIDDLLQAAIVDFSVWIRRY